MPESSRSPDPPPSSATHRAHPLRRIFEHYRSAPLLGVLLVMNFIYPLVTDPAIRLDALIAIYVLLLLVGVLAISGRRRAVVVSVVLSVPMVAAVVYAVIQGAVDTAETGVLVLAASVPFIGHVAFHEFVFINRDGLDLDDRLIAAACAYLLSANVWAGLYALVVMVDGSAILVNGAPVQDSGELRYFSFVTLTTLGYGDVLPMSRVARVLASSEAIYGVFFLAILVGRLMVRHGPKN